MGFTQTPGHNATMLPPKPFSRWIVISILRRILLFSRSQIWDLKCEEVWVLGSPQVLTQPRKDLLAATEPFRLHSESRPALIWKTVPLLGWFHSLLSHLPPWSSGSYFSHFQLIGWAGKGPIGLNNTAEGMWCVSDSRNSPESRTESERTRRRFYDAFVLFCVCAWKFLRKITLALNHQVLGHLQILSNGLEFHDFDSEKNLHILENHTKREPYDLLWDGIPSTWGHFDVL